MNCSAVSRFSFSNLPSGELTPCRLLFLPMSEYPDDWDIRRRQVYQRDRYKCCNCQAEGGPNGDTELHAHHVVPKSEGGSDRYSNLTTLCADCHARVHTDNEELQECREPRDQPLEVVDDVSPDHMTMFPIVDYGDQNEPTEKAIRIGETKYLVVSTKWGRIENYIVDCEQATCDCPYFEKLQKKEKEVYCSHIKTVLSGVANKAGREMLKEQLPETPSFLGYDPDIHEFEDFGPGTPT